MFLLRELFFCARDIRDYLKGLIDTRELDNTPGFDPTFPALTNAPAIQKFLYDMMTFYPHCEEALKAPICGETGIEGLRLDFNFGLRLDVPEGNFHVTISDADSGQIFFKQALSAVRLVSVEKYFIHWQIDVRRDGKKVFSHTLDLEGQPVLLIVDSRCGLGDSLAFLPSIAAFKSRKRCELSILFPEYLRDFVARLYPVTWQVNAINFDNYASYFLSMYTSNVPFCPADHKTTPLKLMAQLVLGIDTLNAKPTFKPTAPRVIREPYVCIGVQASLTRKSWLYPGGWNVVVDYLKQIGYRVLCIDRRAKETGDSITIRKPNGAEDFTGDVSILERANMLYHAEFFIGLGSGLAWLAEAVDCPVVMICGFSKDWYEFHTPYRVVNRLVCGGCFNDVRVSFSSSKMLCPYHNGTARELECQKKISPRMVINAIEQLIVDKKLEPPALKNFA